MQAIIFKELNAIDYIMVPMDKQQQTSQGERVTFFFKLERDYYEIIISSVMLVFNIFLKGQVFQSFKLLVSPF